MTVVYWNIILLLYQVFSDILCPLLLAYQIGSLSICPIWIDNCYFLLVIYIFWKFHAQVFISFLPTPFPTNPYIKPTKTNEYSVYAHVFKARLGACTWIKLIPPPPPQQPFIACSTSSRSRILWIRHVSWCGLWRSGAGNYWEFIGVTFLSRQSTISHGSCPWPPAFTILPHLPPQCSPRLRCCVIVDTPWLPTLCILTGCGLNLLQKEPSLVMGENSTYLWV